MNEFLDKNLITKSNELIQSKYKMTTNEQKILLTVISLVNPLEDKEFREVILTVRELARILNVNERGFYSELNKITTELLTRVVNIKKDTGKGFLKFQWFSECEYLENEGLVKFKLHEKITPYLLDLKKHFTSYQIENVLKFKSKYSIRFYEFMKMYQFRQNFELRLEDIRELFICDNYTRWIHLKEKVIDVAIKEINEKSDIIINWEKIKQGRSVVAIKFFIVDKNPKVKKERKERKSKGKQLNFTNYSQREYDYDSLEKQLLGWD